MSTKGLIRIVFFAVAVFGVATGRASAQTSVGVSYGVSEVQSVSLSGSANVYISPSTPGEFPEGTDDYGVTYSIVNNTSTTLKLVGWLDSSINSYSTLYVYVTAPSGASSNGYVALGTSGQDLVTGIGMVSEGSLAVSFRLQSSVSAGVFSDYRTFYMTLTSQ